MIRSIHLLLIVVFMATSVASCTNGNGEQNFEDLKKVQQGMTIDEVHAVMENVPIRTGVAHWSDSLIYEEYESAFGASDHYKVIYSRLDSAVVQVQWGD